MTTNKKTIYRKDIISGGIFPRDELLRIVCLDGGIHIDRYHKAKGRGAYIKIDEANISKTAICLKAINRALRQTFSLEDIASLQEEIEKNG